MTQGKRNMEQSLKRFSLLFRKMKIRQKGRSKIIVGYASTSHVKKEPVRNKIHRFL